jgi:chaperonin GroEL
MTEENGIKPETFTEEMFGKANKIVISKEDTTIVGGGGKSEAIEQRIENLRHQMDDKTQEWDDAEIKGRIAKLRGGVAVIYVGANTDVEMNEKKDRVEDALAATKSAVEEGIVAGGGIALIEASKALKNLRLENKDQRRGVEILRRAVTAPLMQIADNSGLDPDFILYKAEELGYPIGYDAKANDFGDLLSRGIIDPKKVTRVALESAASIATLILTSEVTVSIIRKEE